VSDSGDNRDLRWTRKTSPKALQAAAVLGFRFHDLRHTFASRLAMEGVELMALRELMGHKSMAMTLRYSRLSPEHRRSAIERLVTRVPRRTSLQPAPSSTVISTSWMGAAHPRRWGAAEATVM
jgi:hypothetical protein